MERICERSNCRPALNIIESSKTMARTCCSFKRSGLAFEIAEPSQRGEAREKTIFAAARYDEARHVLELAPYRPARNGDGGRTVEPGGGYISFGAAAEEGAVVHPLRLNELELPPEVR